MEVLAKRQKAQQSSGVVGRDLNCEIVGGICLFPTIVDLAKSSRGRMASVSSMDDFKIGLNFYKIHR